MKLAGYIDHTLLKAQAMPDDINALCAEAAKYEFAAVCVNPLYVERAAGRLKGSQVQVATVVGFPLGASGYVTKRRQTHDAIQHGATEIDMVMPVGLFLAGEAKAVARDIREVILSAGPLPVKVIIETCYLSPKQIADVSRLAVDEGAAYIKTSTGFGTRGATVEDVRIIKEAVGERCKIKASGGVRDYDQAVALIEAGASRIGTSSGVSILEQGKKGGVKKR
jgi:deoxyribose-phosphate aldolase